MKRKKKDPMAELQSVMRETEAAEKQMGSGASYKPSRYDRCRIHKKYAVKRAPTGTCSWCWAMWNNRPDDSQGA